MAPTASSTTPPASVRFNPCKRGFNDVCDNAAAAAAADDDDDDDGEDWPFEEGCNSAAFGAILDFVVICGKLGALDGDVGCVKVMVPKDLVVAVKVDRGGSSEGGLSARAPPPLDTSSFVLLLLVESFPPFKKPAGLLDWL